MSRPRPGPPEQDDLEVIPKAVIVVAANFVPLLFFFFGTTDVGTVSELSRGLFQIAAGPARFTAALYFLFATTSLLMALIALGVLLTHGDLASQALRAAGGLLGAALLMLPIHLVLTYLVGADWPSRAGIVLVVALIGLTGFAAWRLAKRAAQRD